MPTDGQTERGLHYTQTDSPLSLFVCECVNLCRPGTAGRKKGEVKFTLNVFINTKNLYSFGKCDRIKDSVTINEKSLKKLVHIFA